MKTYKAATKESAERMVARERRLSEAKSDLIDTLWHERSMLARLASDTPQFSNPFHVIEAKKIRDRVLIFKA